MTGAALGGGAATPGRTHLTSVKTVTEIAAGRLGEQADLSAVYMIAKPRYIGTIAFVGVALVASDIRPSRVEVGGMGTGGKGQVGHTMTGAARSAANAAVPVGVARVVPLEWQ